MTYDIFSTMCSRAWSQRVAKEQGAVERFHSAHAAALQLAAERSGAGSASGSTPHASLPRVWPGGAPPHAARSHVGALLRGEAGSEVGGAAAAVPRPVGSGDTSAAQPLASVVGSAPGTSSQQCGSAAPSVVSAAGSHGARSAAARSSASTCPTTVTASTSVRSVCPRACAACQAACDVAPAANPPCRCSRPASHADLIPLTPPSPPPCPPSQGPDSAPGRARGAGCG